MRRTKARSGSVVIEFALMVGLFVVFAMGVAEWGVYLTRRADVVGAVRAAATMVIATESDQDFAAAGAAVARTALTTAGLPGNLATVTIELEGAAPAPVVITVALPYSPLQGCRALAEARERLAPRHALEEDGLERVEAAVIGARAEPDAPHDVLLLAWRG
jgi:Flp pilus assembly protein TadG